MMKLQRIFLGLVLSAVLGCGTDPSKKKSSKPAPEKTAPAETLAPVAFPEETVPAVVPLPTESEPKDPPPPKQPVFYRPSDSRPKHDANALAELGIRRYASKHLELYTDIPPQAAEPLPKLVDQLYAALEKYFGPLPPDREGSTFQMTGYIMADARVFRETGLLPENLPGFNHGRHRGAEFWMNDQKYDYYRRHLMLHEATHCFMTITRDRLTLLPVWYMEGMAELFGTHRIEPDGTAAFRVMPGNKPDFAGLGRITLVQDEIEAGRFLTLDQVFALTANDFSTNQPYAWSWALCKFLDTTPQFHEAFRKLGDAPSRRNFLNDFQTAFGENSDAMRTAWALFAHELQYGYQIEPATVEFQRGEPLLAESPMKTVTIQANRGWQSTGVLLEPGKKYTFTASGQFTLGQTPKPWVSEANGISFRYFDGQPLGKLLGCIRTDSPQSIHTAHSMRNVIPIGSRHTDIATQSGTLYLCLNDDSSERSDNTGHVKVTIRLD